MRVFNKDSGYYLLSHYRFHKNKIIDLPSFIPVDFFLVLKLIPVQIKLQISRSLIQLIRPSVFLDVKEFSIPDFYV